MEEHYTADKVETAALQFYHNPGCNQELNKWLTEAQLSQQAWTFCWQLLQKDKTAEVQFFGANCLHWKIAKCWNEYPIEQLVALKDQLFHHIFQYVSGPKVVLTRLCVSVAALVLHTIPDCWPDAILDLVSTFQSSNLASINPGQLKLVLLDILTVVPEEFLALSFNPHRKSLVRNELQKGFSQVLQLLEAVLTTGSESGAYEQALKCLSSWVEFGAPLAEAERVIHLAFQAVRKEDVFGAAVDAIASVFSHPDNHRFPQTVQKLLEETLQLRGLFEKSLHERDIDTCQGLCKLIVTAADQNIHLLVTSSQGHASQRNVALGLIHFVLACTGVPGHFPVDECCSDLSFGFWYNFQDDIIATDPEPYAQLKDLYSPVYMQLVNILLGKVKYPEDVQYSTWSAEEKESFRCYRQDIADTLMYAYNFLHETLLANLCQLFAGILERSQMEAVNWQDIEAVLFSLASVSESVDPEEFVYLPSVFKMLNKVPGSNFYVVSQALHLIGSYAEWINNHPDALSSVVPLLLQGIKEPPLAQAASMSLKEVVRENQEHIRPFAADILTTTREVLETKNLKARDTVRLMSCLGYVLAILPVPEIMKSLSVLLGPHIQQMQILADDKPSAAVKAGLQLKIQMLSWLFGSLNVNKEVEGSQIPEDGSNADAGPVLVVMRQMTPVLRHILQQWISDVDVVEDISELFRKAMRSSMSDIHALANEFAPLVIEIYNTVPQASILDVAKQILILIASDANQREEGQKFFDIVVTRTLVVLESSGTDQPDLVAAFLVLLSQMLKKNKDLLRSETCNIVGLFHAGLCAVTMQENQVVRAACCFLSDFAASVDTIPAVKEIFGTNGNVLMLRLVRGISGDAPRAVIDSMADVIFALNKHLFDQLCNWMNELMGQEFMENPRVTQEQKQQFARRVLMERANKRKTREIVQEFSLLCRGMLHSQYAIATSTK